MAISKLGEAFVELQLRDAKFRQQLIHAAARAKGHLLARGIREAASEMRKLLDLGIQYNANIEMSRNTFAQLTGSMLMGRKLAKDLREFSERTPFQTGDMNRAAIALLATKKVAQKDVLPIIRKIGDAAAGSSEGFESMPRIIRAISQMLTKGKIQAEEMLQLAEAGVPAWHILAKQMGKSTAEVQKLGQKGKLGIKEVMLLIDGLGEQYKGLADQQSKTFSGLLSTLRDKTAATSAGIFKPLFDEMKRRMADVLRFMDSNAMRNATRALRDGIQQGVDLVSDLIDGMREFSGTAEFGRIVNEFRGMRDLTVEIAKNIYDAFDIKATGGWVTSTLKGMREILDVAATLSSDFSKTWELFQVSAELAVQQALDEITHLWKVWDAMVFNATTQLINMLEQAFVEMLARVKEIAANPAQGIDDVTVAGPFSLADLGLDKIPILGPFTLADLFGGSDQRRKGAADPAEAAGRIRRARDKGLIPMPERAESPNVAELQKRLEGIANGLLAGRERKNQERAERAKNEEDMKRVNDMRAMIGRAGKALMDTLRQGTPRNIGALIKGAPGRAMKAMFGAEEEKKKRKPGKFEFVNIESFNKRIQEAMSDKKKEAREEKKVGLLGKVAGGVQGVKDAVENAVDVLKALPMGFAE